MSTGETPPSDLAANPPSDSAPPASKTRYEFTPEQDRIIADLAGKMGFVGAFLLALALLGFVQVGYVAWHHWNTKGGRWFDALTALNALIYGCLGLWTTRASSAFASVVVTAGRDISHVMDALSSLRWMYSLLYWLLMAAIVATLILALSFSVR